MNDGLTKIRGVGVLATPLSSATLTMAANEFEAFQLFVQAPSTGLQGFRLELPDLKNASNQSLKAAGGRIRIYREHYLDIDVASGVDGGTGFWPDPLIPDRDELFNEPRNAFLGGIPAALAGNPPEWRAYYIEIYLPLGVSFGTLTGTLKASWGAGGAGETFSVPVTVKQNALSLPSTSSLHNFYYTGWTNFCPASGGCPAGYERQQDDFIQYLLDHRLTSRLGAVRVVNGIHNLDAFRTRHARFFDGTSGTAPRADGATILSGAKVTSFMFEPPWGNDEWTRDSNWYAAWKQKFESAGWYLRPEAEGGGVRTFDYTCDEPANGHCATGAYIPPRAASVHGLTAEFPVLVTNPVNSYKSAPVEPVDGTAAYCPDAKQNGDSLLALAGPSIDLAVANSNYVRNGADAGVWVSEIPTCSKISEVWWYQACDVHGCSGNSNGTVAHQPNIMVDVGCTENSCGDSVSAAQNRAMQWFTYYYRFKGELYWDYLASFTLSDPWSSVWYADATGNGDGSLLYPWNQTKFGGTTPVAVPSLRLKILRDGMEDYEYLVALDDLCAGEARKMVIDLFGVSDPPDTPKRITSTRSANVPVSELYRVRAAIADRIAALKANSSLCPSTPPPPPPPGYCPADHPYDCCGDGSACMAVRSKCDVVQCG